MSTCYLRTFPVVVLVWVGVLIEGSAQPFSAGFADNDNLFDAPIPGFVGSGAEGNVDLPAYPLPYGETRVNPLFLNWADTVVDYAPALDTSGNHVVDPFWRFPGEALGPVTGDHFAVVSLGDLDADAIAAGLSPGSLTISFSQPIMNFTGADFAVFENGFTSGYDTGGSGIGGVMAELAYVEVSSDGVHFARFPSVSLTEDPVGSYGSIDPTKVFNLAGKHVNAYGKSWGTPFDLEDLVEDPFVLDGLVDLNAISQIRLIDIPGSGDFLDSLGNPIYDAWVTWGSGGADIEAIGAIGQSQSYEKWAEQWGVSGEDRNADPDGDGWSNFAEYALALDPIEPDGRRAFGLERDDDGDLWFFFRRDERNSDVIYVVESQAGGLDADQWSEVARFGPLANSQLTGPVIAEVAMERIAPQASVGVLQAVFLRIAELPAGERSRFFRLRMDVVEP